MHIFCAFCALKANLYLFTALLQVNTESACLCAFLYLYHRLYICASLKCLETIMAEVCSNYTQIMLWYGRDSH